jgi:ABC-type uncharacterized transport system ATPase subunit
MDDIFIDLDVLESFRLQSLLKMHAKDRTFLLATHDLPLARELCERVLLLDQGRLCFDGSVEDVQKPEFFLPFYQQREVPGEKTSRPLAP